MIALLDYGAGNIRSVQNALQRLGVVATLTHDADTVRQADKVIFPGVGSAGPAMAQLRATGLDALLPQLTQPVLGICLGMQLMCRHSAEGDVAGLGIFDAPVLRFPALGKVPHMGWNDCTAVSGPLFQDAAVVADPATGLPVGTYYFVHSYYVPLCAATAATTDYLLPFSAALARGNFYAVQFHPEKSGPHGQALLQNFLSL
jgi:imidazole glycerol-phosphate synthase subunit HisH